MEYLLKELVLYMGTRKETGRDRDWEREEERGK
jgi:hypothetical protein